MGFLRRLLGKEDPGPTDAFGRPREGEGATGSVDIDFEVDAAPREPGAAAFSFETTPVESSRTTVWVNGVALPPEQAQAVQSALDELKGAGGIDVTQTVDLSAIPGLRGELLQVMGLHSHDPAGMQRAAMEVLRRRGLQIPLPPDAVQASQPPRPERTPAERLAKLAELRDRGVLTDAEYEEQRRRL